MILCECDLTGEEQQACTDTRVEQVETVYYADLMHPEVSEDTKNAGTNQIYMQLSKIFR